MDERKRLKRTGFFLNIIVTALCAVAVASYFTFPLLDFTLSYTVTEEFSDFLIEKMGTKDAEEGSQEDVMNTFITELGKEKMVLTVPLKLQTSFFVNQILNVYKTFCSKRKSKVCRLADNFLFDSRVKDSRVNRN